MKYATTLDETTFTIEINRDDEITVNGITFDVDFAPIGDSNLISLLINNESFEALVEERDGKWHVLLQGHLYTMDVADERAQRMSARTSSMETETGELSVKAPMPGLVVAVPVAEGQEIEENAAVVILESMKMENELRAPRAGVIERINVNPGDSVDKNQVLVIIA